MKKEEILHHFQDINFYYNDCMMYADLSGMLDELIAESKEELTNEKAIAFLQDNGWLVEHDRIMTSGIENKGEWIPVSERLPEIGSHVLVFLKDGYIGTDDYFSYGFDDFKDDVIAWMPLPEPYVEKGESL